MKDSEHETFNTKEKLDTDNPSKEKLTAKEKRLNQRRRIEEMLEEKKLKAYMNEDDYYFSD